MAKTYNNGKRITHDGACPACRAAGKDRTGNHLQFWQNDAGEEWAYCNRCGHYEVDKETLSKMERKERKELTDEEVAEVLKEIQECPIQPLTSRSIALSTAERFQVRVGLSEQDGQTPICHYYPKTVNGRLTGFKVRSLKNKFFYAQGRASGCDFFGINQANQKEVIKHTLYIFEDELSSMSGYEALVEGNKDPKWSHLKPACVALPDGTQSAGRVCADNKNFIDEFKEIVVCMDNDEAGEEAVKVFQQIYPTKVKVVRLPLKDANDMAMANRKQELFQCLRFKARAETPDGAVNLMDVIERALEKPTWGLSYPWAGLTNLTYGIRPEIIAIGGGVGLGKTLIGHELVAHLVNFEKQRIGCFFLEESLPQSLQNIAGKVANVPFHRPDIDYDPNMLRETLQSFGDAVSLWDNKGQNNWDNIRNAIRFWAVAEGRKIFIMDNITALTAHLTPSEINTEISKISSEMAGLCDELGITIFVFSHLNPPSGGKAHEEGGEVKEVQFTGSRALMRWCQVILGFERNKYAEDDVKNISKIKLLKDRNYGNSGSIHTRYIPATGRLVELTEAEYEQMVGEEDPKGGRKQHVESKYDDDKPF